MIEPPIPADEDQRLEDLRRLDLELTEPEEALDTMTARLAHIFEVPAAFISFIDRDTLYAKSVAGPLALAGPRTEPRQLAICSHVVGNNDMLVVEDLLADDRFRDNPLDWDTSVPSFHSVPPRSTSRSTIVECIKGVWRALHKGVLP